MHTYNLWASRLKGGDCPEFKAFLDYRMRPHFKNKNSNKSHRG